MQILEELQGFIAGVSMALATLAVMLLGAKAIYHGVKGEGLRSTFSGLGTIIIGVLFIGAAGLIVSGLIDLLPTS